MALSWGRNVKSVYQKVLTGSFLGLKLICLKKKMLTG